MTDIKLMTRIPRPADAEFDFMDFIGNDANYLKVCDLFDEYTEKDWPAFSKALVEFFVYGGDIGSLRRGFERYFPDYVEQAWRAGRI